MRPVESFEQVVILWIAEAVYLVAEGVEVGSWELLRE
jgi:hypothetical protein